MRELSMYYNKTKNLSALALILAMSLTLAGNGYSQGIISLADDGVDELGVLSEDTNSEVIPVENVATENSSPVTPESVTNETVEKTVSQEEKVITSDKNKDTISETQINTQEVDAVPVTSLDETSQDISIQKDIENLENTLSDLEKEPAPLMAPTDSMLTVQTQNQAEQNVSELGNSVLSQIDNELFAQMSDIEKQTTLLSLELRRERLKNEIEGIKAARQAAIDKAEEERLQKEQRKKDQLTEQEVAKIKEQQVLRDKELTLETLRQEKALNDYKNKLFENEQKWVKENRVLLDKIQEMKKEQKATMREAQKKMDSLKEKSAKLVENAEAAKENAENTKANFESVIANLNAQIEQLKKRLEAEIAARSNPFAEDAASEKSETAGEAEISPEELNLDYVIMEIRGKGDDLIAKLVNKDGESFLVKKGSILQTGHVIKRITHTLITLEKEGLEDYLQFAAGGVVSQEPSQANEAFQKIKSIKEQGRAREKAAKEAERKSPKISKEKSIPSLGNNMFVK